MNFQATPVTSILRMHVTDDKKNILLELGSGQKSTTLAIPHELLRPLLSLVCTGLGTIEAGQMEGRTRPVFNPQTWDLKQAEDASLIFCFDLKEGVQLSFQVGPSNIPRLRGVLELMEEKAHFFPRH